MNNHSCNTPTAPLMFENFPVVGLTGGIGSGKSQVSQRLQQHGVPIIDTDCIAHELTGQQGAAMPAIAHAFGPQALNSDGSLNRAYMRDLIFAQAQYKQSLESILHPAIREHVLAQLQRIVTEPTQSPSYVVVVVPLLFESTAWRQTFKQIVVVDCTPETQIERVRSRNGWPLAQIHAVLAQQASRQTRLAGADHVIHNHGSLVDLQQQVDALHTKLTSIFQSHLSQQLGLMKGG